MARSRREFLEGMAAVVATAGALTAEGQVPQAGVTPGAPPAFGTATATGPKVGTETFAEAEKLVQVSLSAEERAQAAGNWQQSMAALFERRVGPRKVELGEADVPGTGWNPIMFPDRDDGEDVFGYLEKGTLPDVAKTYPGARELPGRDEDIAFASLRDLGAWILGRKLTSERLTRIYLERLRKFDPQLRCVILLCEEHALEQAKNADRRIAAGVWMGPLHGIPWGAKDLLDTKGIRTTWGAEFYRDRVPAEDAFVVKRLNEAGAVLVAKLSLGTLALNDIWFGGQTMNPWNLDEGSSGSSAGPGAAVAAGLVAFAIGSETQGSIISPCMRCGVTGLRPTYGRVPTAGAMTLSWTCDKLGVIARDVADTATVLNVIAPKDDEAHWLYPPPLPGQSLRVGYVEKWMHEAPATEVDRHALEVMKGLGMTAVPVELPDWPYDSLNVILFAEAAAAFEEMTLDGRVNQLKMQTPDAWPNTFRQSRFLSAVDYVQANRLRRKVAVEVAKLMEKVDVLLVPSMRDEPMVIFNFTGHPSLTLRAGFVEVTEERSDWAPDPKKPLKKFSPARRVPYGVTLVGRLFDEGTVCAVGRAMEKAFKVSEERPKGF